MEERVEHKTMNAWMRSALTIAVVLVGYSGLLKAFHLMNLPSDRTFYGGSAMVVGLVLGVPLLLHLIWRRER